MRLSEVAPLDVRPALTAERAALLELLRGLDDEAWIRETAVPRWAVKDIALHVLDDDLGWLSRGRDGDLSGLLDDTGDYQTFVAALAAKNQARAGRGRSPDERRARRALRHRVRSSRRAPDEGAIADGPGPVGW